MAFPLGTLIWTPNSLRPIETLQVGDSILAFNPETFSRVPVTIQRVQVQPNCPTRRLEVGGRILSLAETHPCPVFDLNGNWQLKIARDIGEGDFLPVDRLIPVPATPIALPPLDEQYTQLMGEDPLALSDALYNSAAYFREMEKRELRLAFYELLGSFWDTTEWSGTPDIAVLNDQLIAHYNTLSQRIFGTFMSDPTLLSRIKGWIGEGVLPFPWRALPIWVWQLANPAISAFLRGYFDNAASFTSESITIHHDSLRLLVGVQSLLGRLHIESNLIDHGMKSYPSYTLTIRNIRRYAEWIHSSVPRYAGLLKAVYTREPRYPSDSTAHLPLNVIRPALERIRNRHTFPTRTNERANKGEITKIETLRLLATAFNDTELRDAVNQQLYLEPVTNNITAYLDTLFILSVGSPATIIANGVVVGGKEIRVKSEE